MCIDPNHERAMENKKLYEEMIEENKQQEQQQEGSSGVFVNKQKVNITKDFDRYERLCRGEQTHVGIPLCSALVTHIHRRRSGWNSGGRMASAEGGSLRVGWCTGGGCVLFIRLEDLGSVVSSPSGVRGRAPAENGFWHILKGHKTLLFVPI